MTTTTPHPEPAVLVTRMLAAAGDSLPFATFELTLQQAQPDIAALREVEFRTYAGDVVYSNDLRQGLDDALARDWVRVQGQRLRVTPRGEQALDQIGQAPEAHEREVLMERRAA